MTQGPFHDGERAIQEITGERGAAEANGRIIGDSVPPPAVPFVGAQDMVVLSREDGQARLWPGIAFGPKGFASLSDDRRTLTLRPTGGATMASAPLHGLARSDRLGALFIELATRRRLRVNGTVAATADGIEIAIEEAYPACPKYIQRRVVEAWATKGDGDGSVETGIALTAALRLWIAEADTMFVASGPRGSRLDVSHRGGLPGFLRVGGEEIRVPDYPGNSMFNTLGNFQIDPRAGLVVPDFTTGAQLSLTGAATLHVEGPPGGDPNDPNGGTERWWDFSPEAWVVTHPAAERRWGEADPSPFNPKPAEIA